MEYYYPNELYHHGIKGMKWGVRRYQKKDGTLTPAGKKRYSEEDSSKHAEESVKQNNSKDKKKLTRKQKAILIGASVVAAYATYKFVDSGSATRLIAKGKAALGMSSLDFKRDLSLANKDMTADDIYSKVVKRINPGYGGLGTKMNCRRCTFAYEVSRRGFDVKATKSLNGTGQTVVGLENAIGDKKQSLFGFFKDAVFDDNSLSAKFVAGDGGFKKIVKSDNDGSYAKTIFKGLSDYQDGARGELMMKWSGGGAHSMAWEIVKGKPVIFDCQTGEKYDSSDAFEMIAKHITSISSTRLDNLDLNSDFLLRWVTNA